jgi:hypothetical protein
MIKRMSYKETVWWVGFALVVLTGLANEADAFPVYVHHYIMVAATVTGLIMAYMKQQPPDTPTAPTTVDPADKPFVK